MKLIRLPLIAGTIAVTLTGLLEARTWTSSEGKAIEAEFLRFKGDTHIVIEMKGKEYTVPLTKFSQKDLEWLEEKKESEAESAIEKAEKAKAMTGRFDNKPIHSRLFPEAEDYFKDRVRKKMVRDVRYNPSWGEINSGTQAEWMKRDFEKDTCSIYVPSSYDGSEPYGIFLYINHSPNAYINKAWYPVFDQFKIIAVSANKTGNYVGMVRRVCLSMDALATVEKDYKIDPTRRVVCGTSGGGHMAMVTAAMFPEMFLGAISSAAQSYLPGHFPGMDLGDFKRGARKKNKWLVISGDKDKNYKTILKTSREWHEARLDYQFIDVPGMAHVPPPADRLPECLEWIGIQKPQGK